MARRRGFGEIERRVSASGEVTYRARYAMPDGSRFSRTLGTKLDAEAWLAAERCARSRSMYAAFSAQAAHCFDTRQPGNGWRHRPHAE